LVRLAKHAALQSGDLDAGARRITEASSQTLEVERAGIWLFNDHRSKMRCIDLYELSRKRHKAGGVLEASRYPAYFKALQEERTIPAHEARRDPRTREFTKSYLRPLGIRSMLDAPIRLGGEVIGVICHEHKGEERRWTSDEENFAGSMADMVSLMMEGWKRTRAEKELESSLSLLRATLESTADGLLVVDRAGKFVTFNRKFVKMWRVPKSIVRSKDDNRAIAFVLDQLKDPGGFQRKIRELYAQPEAESFDILTFKDGKIFERYSQPQRIGGKSVGRVWSFRDVTQRKRSEEALQKAHDELEKQVQKRTTKLTDTNVRLKEQITERRRAERALRHTTRRLRQLSHHVLQMQENEYKFISRELHDTIGQSLHAVRMGLERLIRGKIDDPSIDRQEINAAVSQLIRVSQELRTLSKQMRSEILDELGLGAALEAHVRDFQKRTGIRTEFICKTSKSYHPDLQTHLYRIAQEALNNVARHSSAGRVVIALEDAGKERILSVSDNGIGFFYDPMANKSSRGIGLISMQERADILKGTLEILAGPGDGTKIIVKVPLPEG
jgi:PAS domain S-box-containing protein